MLTIDVDNWEQFEDQLRELQEQHSKRGSLLFRGLEDHRFTLSTTLERQGQQGMSFIQYYRLISVVKPQIESFVGINWDVPTYPEYREWLERNDSVGLFTEFPAYDYMVYLRHHGFPSPLLDWTASPYVAAYFAFRGIDESQQQEHHENRVTICVYRKSRNGSTIGSFGRPEIHELGPDVRTHRRHFLQQSRYTVCIVRSQNGASDHTWRYASHEDVFDRQSSSQDLLWKYQIPATEWRKVQGMLDRYNLNAFSLFGSEESLMETMALRELHLREKKL